MIWKWILTCRKDKQAVFNFQNTNSTNKIVFQLVATLLFKAWLSSPPPQSALQPSCWGQCRPSSGQHGRSVCQHPERRWTGTVLVLDTISKVKINICVQNRYTYTLNDHNNQHVSQSNITLMAVMAKAIFLLPSMFVLRTRRMCWNFSGMTRDWKHRTCTLSDLQKL